MLVRSAIMRGKTRASSLHESGEIALVLILLQIG